MSQNGILAKNHVKIFDRDYKIFDRDYKIFDINVKIFDRDYKIFDTRFDNLKAQNVKYSRKTRFCDVFGAFLLHF